MGLCTNRSLAACPLPAPPKEATALARALLVVAHNEGHRDPASCCDRRRDHQTELISTETSSTG